jgi:hypothetical protein
VYPRGVYLEKPSSHANAEKRNILAQIAFVEESLTIGKRLLIGIFSELWPLKQGKAVAAINQGLVEWLRRSVATS